MSNNTSTPSRWRLNRSSTNLLAQVAQPAANPPKASTNKPLPKLERSASRMSLFNLFSRPKVEKARGHIEVGLAVPMPPPEQQSNPDPVSTPKPATQQAHRSRSSQMLRPISMRPTSMIKDSDRWDPPPLFQAYPQSIKHATLQSCVFSPDALLRTQSQRKQYDMMRERMDSQRDLAATLEDVPETKKLEKTHKRLVSNSVMNPATPQLTNKVYVLVTSGYVLQYAGDGSFDRLPEKVLKLGKDSAAFACDAIPGKHWVLQISQSANQDGTVAIEPKSSLLSRLRSQNSPAKRAAASFLLVLNSAEELDVWMSTVRKEIENFGGMKAKEETVRESSSIEISAEKQPEHRAFMVKRDPNRMSKAPIDSPLQSQYSDSPKIVTTEWETNRTETTGSVTGSDSSKHSSNRRSEETASIATTVVSHDQDQLDQLREKPRYSYVSTATSVSVPGTRNTSRSSSPTPTSPLKEAPFPVDAEPFRSATSLKSFHMSTITNRRRSMQPLPVTNENNSLSADTAPITPLRHSFYGPLSPTVTSEPKLAVSTSAPLAPVAVPAAVQVPARTSQLAPLLCQPSRNVRNSLQPPARSGMRSSSAPPVRHGALSPPPRYPAPPPGRPQSTLGTATLSPHANRRLSQSPKPFLRPFPVRPHAQYAERSSFTRPQRLSSLGPPPMSLGSATNRSFTAPVSLPSTSSANHVPKPGPPSQPLRRPTSVQIRSDHAPFLSSSRPVRAIASTPSFVPGKRASAIPSIQVHQATSAPAIMHVQQAQQPPTTQHATMVPRQSVRNLGLPPPVPPPTTALPCVPLDMSLPPPLPQPNMPLPALPLPTPPPTVPLPVPPVSAPAGVAF